MKQNIKKSALLVCTLALFLPVSTVFAAGGQQKSSGFNFNTTKADGRDFVNNTYVSGLPIVKEPITLKTMVVLHPQTERNNYERKVFAPMAEKATGIKIEWILPANDAIPAIIASGDLPDVFWRGMGDSDMVSGHFLELTDQALKTYAPNVWDIYENHVEGWRSYLTQPDGKIYGLMGGYWISFNHLVDQILWINTEWLKRVGKAMPATTSELFDVLKAFKEQDANGNGDPNDEIPFDFCNLQYGGRFGDLASSWGIYNTYNVKNGKILPSVNTPEYREFLEFYHRLATEGLINIEGFSQTTQQYFADIAANKAGIFGGWAPNTFSSDPALTRQYAPLGILAVPGKENLRVAPGGSKKKINANRNNFLITNACKYPEAALRLWDYLSTDGNAQIVFGGAEGIAWKKTGFLSVELLMPSVEQTRKDGVSSPGQYQQTMGYNNHFPLILSYTPPDVKVYPDLDTAQKRSGIEKIYDFITDEPLPSYVVPRAAQEERALIEADLMPVINSFQANSVLEGVTDAKWNEYVRQLETFRYGEYLAWMQKYYDNKF
jgi:putative aldouronate transport system substrate-binding protein